MKFKRQCLPGNQRTGNDNTDQLGGYRRDRGAACPEMKARDQKKISRDIGDTGNQYCYKRRIGITHAAENTADQVIGNNDDRTRAADPDILRCQVKCLLRRMHDSRKLRRKRRNQQRQNNAGRQKEQQSASCNSAAFFRLLLSDLLTQQNGYSHAEAADQVCDRHHDLRTGGNRGYVRRTRELPYNQQIDRAVHCL